MPFARYFGEWIELYKSNRHTNTYARYQNSLERVREHFKDMPIQKITRTDYQRFLNAYGKGKTRETVRKLFTGQRSLKRLATTAQIKCCGRCCSIWR